MRKTVATVVFAFLLVAVPSGSAGTSTVEATVSKLVGVRSLAVDPVSATTVYAGTDRGLKVSTDGGRTWRDLWSRIYPTGNRASVFFVTVDARRPQTIYISTEFDGVFRTVDGGRTWSTANKGLGTYTVRQLAIDPHASGTVYAATGDPYGNGVYKDRERRTHVALVWAAQLLRRRNCDRSPNADDPLRGLLGSHVRQRPRGGHRQVERRRTDLDRSETWDHHGLRGVVGNRSRKPEHALRRNVARRPKEHRSRAALATQRPAIGLRCRRQPEPEEHCLCRLKRWSVQEHERRSELASSWRSSRGRSDQHAGDFSGWPNALRGHERWSGAARRWMKRCP